MLPRQNVTMQVVTRQNVAEPVYRVQFTPPLVRYTEFSLLHHYSGIQSSVYTTTIQVYRGSVYSTTIQVYRGSIYSTTIQVYRGSIYSTTIQVYRGSVYSTTIQVYRGSVYSTTIQVYRGSVYSTTIQVYRGVQFTPPPFKYTEDVGCIWRYQGWGIPVFKRMMRLRKI